MKKRIWLFWLGILFGFLVLVGFGSTLLAAPDGTMLVSWKDATTLCSQLRDAADKPLGKVESRPGRNPHRHAGVVTKEGNFLLID